MDRKDRGNRKQDRQVNHNVEGRAGRDEEGAEGQRGRSEEGPGRDEGQPGRDEEGAGRNEEGAIQALRRPEEGE